MFSSFVILLGLLSVHSSQAEQAELRPIILEHYTNYQVRRDFQLINALARVKYRTKYFHPFLGGSYEDYNADTNSYAMTSALAGVDIPILYNKVKLRVEYKVPNSSAYQTSTKYGFYTGHYQKISTNFTFDSYAEVFQVYTPTTSYNNSAAWAQVMRDSLFGTEHLKPHAELYYRDSLFENTMVPLKELRVGLWYQYAVNNFVAKIRGFAYSDVYNKRGLSAEFVMGGTF